MNETLLNQEIADLQDQVISWRRHLHQHPELSFQEVQTAQFVYDTLSTFGGLGLSRPTRTSVVARLRGNHPGRVIALRADMDALPIQEENTFDFASQNSGVMHACGHDGHTSMLLAVAKLLASRKDELCGEIRFIFQHAEELPPGGAAELVDAGIMDNVDHVIGTHLWSPLDTGKTGITYGPTMAGIDTYEITILGKGGHAGLPHETVDSIAVGSQVVTNLQHIVSRNTDPLSSAVISVTKFLGGNTHNIIPGSVQIEGTVRTLDNERRKQIPSLMERIIRGITEAHNAEYRWKYHYGYDPVVNDEKVARIVEETAREVLGKESPVRLKPNMGGEDFSAYQKRSPGTFFFTGARNEEKGITYPHHHPRFTIDEAALENGIKMLVYTALKLSKKEAKKPSSNSAAG
ncbi:M20 family metallopeptidase [Paludifilum halophilum]|uniref:N-acyl-L-amino acid amidohydrolase n=1 Tax=Paludifilum halophilum TaxID=1642702 RepID=A0A235B722_9BACL|nr:M20 family metallopeptidase [Paludifilum halophilum]OYD07779.1 N-acyl-L-amino acid amidohydrolase [Paludifilum halophilum]